MYDNDIANFDNLDFEDETSENVELDDLLADQQTNRLQLISLNNEAISTGELTIAY